jgi:hypothetical protein
MDDIKLLFTLITGLLAGIWGYLVYIIGRGIIPSIEFDIDYEFLGDKQGKSLIQLFYIVRNVGQSPLVVSELKTKIRYCNTKDDTLIENDPAAPAYGHLIFSRSLGSLLQTGDPFSSKVEDTALPVIRRRTFVQPGVTQKYNLTICLPEEAEYILVKGFLTYLRKPLKKVPELTLELGEKIGIIPFLFRHIDKPHTFEKTFKVRQANRQEPLAEHI